MKLINREKIEIPRDRAIVKGGLIYVPLADVQTALDTARVIFGERDVATVVEALDRQVKKWPKMGCCPTCEAPVREADFCGSCGQALARRKEVAR